MPNRGYLYDHGINTLHFSFEGRTERLISVGRVVLASFSLLAIWLDPTTPSKYATLTYSLLVGYVIYALAMALLVAGIHRSFIRLRFVSHVFDLAVFCVLIYLTEGPTSPFFLYFVFSILCGTLRWHWRGTLWTALVALAAFVAMGFYAEKILHDPDFELNRFIMRGSYLGVVAVLFGYLGLHESQRRRQLSELAAWPRAPLLDLERVLGQIMVEARNILKAQRVLMIWEESEEPWIHLALFSAGKIERNRKPTGSFTSLVADPLGEKSFFSQDVRKASAVVVDGVSHAAQRWQGAPVNDELRCSFDITSVLSVSLVGENFQGRLFFLDRPGLTTDDVVLGEIVAAQVVTSMDLFYFLERLKQVATVGERIRLSRDLHDGVLQSITTAGLKLRVAAQLLDTDVKAAKAQIANVQELIVQEQRDLRSFIESLKPVASSAVEADFKLTPLLEELVRSAERQWSLHVELKMDGLKDRVPASLGREVYQLIREGIINAARHARASMVQVDLGTDEGKLRISVSDNGQGFSFRGRYDDVKLADSGLGPAILRSRVAALGGSLSIESSESGARLEMILPFLGAVA